MKLVDFLKVFQETEINGYLTVMQQCSCCESEKEIYREHFVCEKIKTTIEKLQKFMEREIIRIEGEAEDFGGIVIVVKDRGMNERSRI